MVPFRTMRSPSFHPYFLASWSVDYYSRTVALPGQQLIRGHFEVGEDLEDFVRISPKLGEESFPACHLCISRQTSCWERPPQRPEWRGSSPGKTRAGLRQRYAMANDQALRGLNAVGIDVESAPDGHHQSQQQQRESNAHHGQEAPPLVTKRALGHEAS